jgi:hypothetical protein
MFLMSTLSGSFPWTQESVSADGAFLDFVVTAMDG